MDYSSLTETQQQQEQQQSYYTAQAHAYEAYYGYHQQHYDASASHHQYYYPHDYAAAYHQQQHSAAASQDSSAIPALQPGTSQATQHQVVGPGVPGYPQDNQGSYSVPPGLNPAAAAAVAALSQLSQFAGTMDAAERAMAGVQGRQWHGKGAPGTTGQMPHHPYRHPAQRGGMRPGAGGRAAYGRRGGGPFRGSRGDGRANLGHHSEGPDNGALLFRGRGRRAHRGRAGGRRSHQSAKTSATESESAETQISAPAPVLPRQPLLPVAWCDICRVDCNSLEILEQHKSGKRHKRTVQRFNEIQAQKKLLAEMQAQATLQGFDAKMTQPQPVAESQEGIITPPEAVVQDAKEDRVDQVDEQVKTSTVSEKSQEAFACENTTQSELQGQIVDEQKVSAETEGIIYLPPVEEPTRGRPMKRKMTRFGRGGKKFRYSKPTESRPQERPKEQRPKEPPRVCTLCNVMCETQVVFDSHIAGKKHVSRIKRFQGNAVFGPLEVYIPPNQSSMPNPPGLQPLFFGLKTQEMVHLLAHEPSLLMETCGSDQPGHGELAFSVSQMEQVGGSQSGEGLGIQDHTVVSEVKADDVTTTENVEVQGEAACRLTKHVSAEAETAFET